MYLYARADIVVGRTFAQNDVRVIDVGVANLEIEGQGCLEEHTVQCSQNP
jgi:hypothetical protein